MFHKTLAMTAVFFLVSACSVFHAKHTDEDAWNDFRKENHAKPVSGTELNQFLDQIPLRTVLLSCFGNEPLKNCYQSKLSLAFDDAFRKAQKKNSSLSDLVYKQEQKRFFQEESFEEVFASVQSFHQVLLSGIDVRAVEKAKELNEDCEKRINEEAVVQNFKEFNGGTTEVPKGQFACLSESWSRRADKLLNETLNSLSLVLVTKQSGEWIKRYQIYPIYHQETQVYLNKKFEQEKLAWNQQSLELEKTLSSSDSLEKVVKDNSPGLRKVFPHLPVEALLTEMIQKRKGPTRRVAALPTSSKK